MMNEQVETPIEETVIEGYTRFQWTQVLKTLSADPGWLVLQSMLAPEVEDAGKTNFNSPLPEQQFALHEAIGFLKFANRVAEIRNRARFISERGVSPDAASRGVPL